LAAGFLSVLGLFAAGAAYVERTELRTDHLVLLDKFGQPRVDLGVDIDGKAALQFLDKDQKPRLSISSRPGGSPVGETGKQRGNGRAALAVAAFGPPSLNLADQNGKVRFSAKVSPAGAPELEVMGRDGHVRLSLGMRADGRPVIDLRDQSGRVRSIFGLN